MVFTEILKKEKGSDLSTGEWNKDELSKWRQGKWNLKCKKKTYANMKI